MAGKMKNCSSCGKVFISINNSRICMDCREKEEQWEKEVVTYVRDHPKSQISEIVEATGVQEPIIRRMIREGRFVSTGAELFYPCEKCQKELRDDLAAHMAKQRPAGKSKSGDGGQGHRGYVTLGKK